MHTLVIVRPSDCKGRAVSVKGVNYKFAGVIAKAFCAIKELNLAFRHKFLFLFFKSALTNHSGKKRKVKNKNFFSEPYLNNYSQRYFRFIIAI